MAQPVPARRGIPQVQQPKKEGGRTQLEGKPQFAKDVVTPSSKILMGDEGVPNPAQYFIERARA